MNNPRCFVHRSQLATFSSVVMAIMTRWWDVPFVLHNDRQELDRNGPYETKDSDQGPRQVGDVIERCPTLALDPEKQHGRCNLERQQPRTQRDREKQQAISVVYTGSAA
jgi:hypothetical protein